MHRDAGQVEVVEQVPVLGVGQQDLAVHPGDVAGQGRRRGGWC